MWELYTFWAFVPILLLSYFQQNKLGLVRLAMVLSHNCFWCIGLCCWWLHCTSQGKCQGSFCPTSDFWDLLSSLAFGSSSSHCTFSCFSFCSGELLWWEIHPNFRHLLPTRPPRQYIGTALTITNCIGFAITIVSLQLIGNLVEILGVNHSLIFLIIGPILGLMSLNKLSSK